MSYALLLNDYDNSSGSTPPDQAIDCTESNECEANTSRVLEDSLIYRNHSTKLKNNNDTKSANNKLRNAENRKMKIRKVLLYKDYKCRCDTAAKCVSACRPRGYRVISQSAQELMCKSTLRPKYVVVKRDPKLRPLEDTAPRKTKRREWVDIKNNQQPSCSTRKSKEREKAEKTTYCRPVININEDYEAKVAERNIRLQNIVQKLIEARQIEKQRETWNNFINELKTRHGLNTVYTYENELIDEYGNVKINAQPAISKPVKYYIEDMYPHSSSMAEQEIKSNIYDYSKTKLDNSTLLYEVHPYLCYPHIPVKEKTSKRTNSHCDTIICSEADMLDENFDTLRQKYERKKEYVLSEISVYSRDLSDNEENRTREGRNNKYRQPTDRIASRSTTPYNRMVQNPVTPRWPTHEVKKEALKINAERRSPLPSTTKNNVSDYAFKQKQMQSKYKKIFEDIATYKTQNMDDNSHITLGKIENKLDLLIQGISELLQEIKPKCALINEKDQNKVSRQNSEQNIRCRHCIGNDSECRLGVKKEMLKQEIPKQSEPKTITKILCKNPQCSKKMNVKLVEDLDTEYDKCYKAKSILDKSATLKTWNHKLEETCYDKHRLYEDATGKEYTGCVRGYTPIENCDRRGQDHDPFTEVLDRCRYHPCGSYCPKRKETPVHETEAQLLLAQHVEHGKRRIDDVTGNNTCDGLNTNQTFDEEYGKSKNNNNPQNEERGSERNKQSCITETCQKYKHTDGLSQKYERCKKFGISSMSEYDKNEPKEHNFYGKERFLSLDRASVTPKSNAERKQEPRDLFPKRQNFLPSCKRQELRDTRQDTNYISEINRPLLERRRPSSTETEPCFTDSIKKIRQEQQCRGRRQEPEKYRQSSNDKISQLKGQIPKSGMQTCCMQKKIKNPEPPVITGTLSTSDSNVEKTSGEKETFVVVEKSRESVTRFVSKNNEDLETEQDQKIPMFYIQRGLGYDTLDRKDVIFQSISDSETRKSHIDDSTSVNRVLNVSRGSSPHRDDENRYGFKKEDRYVCAVAESHGSPFCNNHRYGTSRIDKIIIEEMNKSDQAKRDIEEILNGEFGNTCAVSFAFEVPTSDRATEVTNSLSAAVPYRGNELFSYDSTSSTITTVAVNTDPMSILGLLTLSTDTIRNLLGQVNLNQLYRSLAHIMSIPRLLPLSSLGTIQRDIPGFICNICGSVFRSRSELSLHNRDHIDRDCCVCRHLLDMRKRRHAGLFTCVYCGQCFTRAYCCELHQHVCARKRGIKHDVEEKLSILR